MKERATRTIEVIILTLVIIILIRIRDLRNCIIPMMEYMNARSEFENRLLKAVSEEMKERVQK